MSDYLTCRPRESARPRVLLPFQDRLQALRVLALVAADQLHRAEPLGQQHAETYVLHLQRGLDALSEAVHEVQRQAQLELVDASGLAQIVPEQLRELVGRLVFRRDAEALRIVSEAVHDVGDRQFARATHDAVVAGSAHPHGGGLSTSSRLPARIIMNSSCGG